MSKPLITEHNAQTGETETREMTDEEFADFQELVKQTQRDE